MACKAHSPSNMLNGNWAMLTSERPQSQGVVKMSDL